MRNLLITIIDDSKILVEGLYLCEANRLPELVEHFKTQTPLFEEEDRVYTSLTYEYPADEKVIDVANVSTFRLLKKVEVEGFIVLLEKGPKHTYRLYVLDMK